MDNFSVNSLIKECIENNDIKGLRVALATIIYGDRDFNKGEFENSLNYVVNDCGIKEVFEEFDSKTPLVSKSVGGRSFTEEDFADAVYELKINFCEERIKDVKEISRALYLKKEETKITYKEDKVIRGDEPVKKSSTQQKKEQSTITPIIKATIITVATIGAIALIVKAIKN